jgi:phenylacetate-CoA ligase
MLGYVKTLYHLQQMMRRAYWPLDKLLEYQNKRLRRIAEYAYDFVPFYRKKFREIGVRPSEVRTVGDLERLPIIRKDELRRNLGSVISKEFVAQDLRLLSTSGSTGKPLKVFVNKDEDNFRKAKHLRANISCGQRPLDRWVTITSPSHFSETTATQQKLGVFSPRFVSVFDDTRKQASTIGEMRPDVLDGYSSALYLLAREVEKANLKTIQPRMIFGGAELADPASRRYVEEVFDAPFYDQYATIEFERMAWQCSVKRGYHIDADAMIMQFVDENGEEVSEGETGEIVCTSLFNYAMPFIRYAIGDVGSPSNEECQCGRGLPLMEVIQGRKDSLLFLPNGRTLSPRTFTIAINKFRLSEYIEQFSVTQKKSDYFEIQIKIQYGNVNKTSVEKELPEHLRKTFHLGMEEITFDVKFVEEIPLDKSGKLMIVKSELKQPL